MRQQAVSPLGHNQKWSEQACNEGRGAGNQGQEDASEQPWDKPPPFHHSKAVPTSIRWAAEREVMGPSYFSIDSQKSRKHN